MNCTVLSERFNEEVRITLSGHLDTGASQKVQEEIDEALKEVRSEEKLVIDIADLNFLSSSGLRIMLTLRKRYPQFTIINACQSVYDVFEMTGFSRMMTVQKAMRHMKVSGLQEIGRGGVGIVYRISEDTIVKVFNKGSNLEDIKREINLSKEAIVFGLPTAISYDVVKIDTDDKSECQYGLVYELLEADTLSNVISRQPEKLEYYARKFGQLYREMHSIEVPEDSTIPSAHAHEEWALDKIAHCFDDEIMEKAHSNFALLSPGNRLLHCDLHPKNVMLQGDELMLIDMGEVGYGNPLLDLSHTCSVMKHCVGDYKLLTGLSEDLGQRFFQIALDEYFKDVSPEEKAKNIELMEKITTVRTLTWLSLLDSVPESVSQQCAKMFRELTHMT